MTKKKTTISLSEKSLKTVDELRRITDADSDSEVFRNALRIHLTLIRAQAAGGELFIRSGGREEALPVTMFAGGKD